MSNRIFEDKNGEFGGRAEYMYLNPAHMFYELVDPKDLNVVGGRALGKTTTIIARRTLRINKSMPGSYLAFVGDYYSNLLSNTVPSMLKGWEDNGLVEGKDFVVNERPPAHFDKPYKRPITYKHTVSFSTGTFYKLASMDVVSSVAGDSYQHVVGDEVKYLDKKKLDKLLPAKRGERLSFEHSPYYLGTTFTTDMPNELMGTEYGWILDMENNMDVEQIKIILYASLTVNDIKMAMAKAFVKKDANEFAKQKRNYERWNQRLYKARFNSTLFHVVSSFANADILTVDWFRDQLALYGIEGFKTAILSLKHELNSGEKFYPQFQKHHLYDGGVEEKFYDNVGFGEVRRLNSLGLKYCNQSGHLEAGSDFGRMTCMIVGQPQGWNQRILKTFHTLAPKFIDDLAQDFVEFFCFHRKKHLKLWHDRSSNANKSVGFDMATKLKVAIEGAKINGISQGWKVELMSEGQGTIYQFQDFNVVNQIFSENNPKLPKILIDRLQCIELISALNLAKMIVKPNRHGVNQIHKNKTSESLPLKSLPMKSTNYTDAFKYYFCRPQYMKEVEANGGTSSSYAPVVHQID